MHKCKYVNPPGRSITSFSCWYRAGGSDPGREVVHQAVRQHVALESRVDGRDDVVLVGDVHEPVVAVVVGADDATVAVGVAVEQQAEHQETIALPQGGLGAAAVGTNDFVAAAGALPDVQRAPVGHEAAGGVAEYLSDHCVSPAGQVAVGVQEQAVVAEDRELVALGGDRDTRVLNADVDLAFGGLSENAASVAVAIDDGELDDGHVIPQFRVRTGSGAIRVSR